MSLFVIVYDARYLLAVFKPAGVVLTSVQLDQSVSFMAA